MILRAVDSTNIVLNERLGPVTIIETYRVADVGTFDERLTD